MYDLLLQEGMWNAMAYILGISKLRWIRVGEFNADDHYIHYCGQESLRRKGVALIFNERV